MVVCFLPLLARADDGVASISEEGIVFEKTDAIRMTKEVLDISGAHVQVDFEFVNDSDTPRTVNVAFPMPADNISYDPVPYEYVPVHGPFRTWVNGNGLSRNDYHIRHIARMDHKDVSAELKKLGLPLDQFVESKHLAPATLAMLKEKGYYTESMVGDEQSPKEFIPQYALQTIYWWKQTFPPHKVVRISHFYDAQLGGNSIGMTTYAEKWRSIAPNIDGFREKICAEACKSSDAYNTPECSTCRNKYSAQYLNYVLTSGATWKNGIEDFTLHVHGASVVFAEVEDKPYGGYDELTLHLKNFVPTKELAIEFIGMPCEVIPPPPPTLSIKGATRPKPDNARC